MLNSNQLKSFRSLAFLGVLLLAGTILPRSNAFAGLLPPCSPIPGKVLIVRGIKIKPRPTCGVEHLIELAVNVYNFLLGFAVVVLLLMLVWGGLRMIIGFATGDPEANYKTGKSTVMNALAGFAIIAVAYVLVNTLLVFLGIDTGSELSKILVRLGFLQTNP